MPKLKNSNATFLVIFKHCVMLVANFFTFFSAVEAALEVTPTVAVAQGVAGEGRGVRTESLLMTTLESNPGDLAGADHSPNLKS